MFIISILCNSIDESHRKNHFFENKNRGKKFFLQNILFLFYHRFSVPSLITISFKKVVHGNSFSEKPVLSKNKLYLHLSFLCTRWYFKPNLSNFFFIFESDSQLKKGPKHIFFLFSGFRTPTDNKVLWKILSGTENFHRKVFSVL